MISDTPKPDLRPSLWVRIGEVARAVDAAIHADPGAEEIDRLKRQMAALEARLDGLNGGSEH